MTSRMACWRRVRPVTGSGSSVTFGRPGRGARPARPALGACSAGARRPRRRRRRWPDRSSCGCSRLCRCCPALPCSARWACAGVLRRLFGSGGHVLRARVSIALRVRRSPTGPATQTFVRTTRRSPVVFVRPRWYTFDQTFDRIRVRRSVRVRRPIMSVASTSPECPRHVRSRRCRPGRRRLAAVPAPGALSQPVARRSASRRMRPTRRVRGGSVTRAPRRRSPLRPRRRCG